MLRTIAFAYICDGLKLVGKLYGTTIQNIVRVRLQTTQTQERNWSVPQLRDLTTLGRYVLLCDGNINFNDFLLFAGLDLTQVIVRNRHHIDITMAIHAYDMCRTSRRQMIDEIVKHDIVCMYGFETAETWIKWWQYKRQKNSDEFFKPLRMILSLGFGVPTNLILHVDDLENVV